MCKWLGFPNFSREIGLALFLIKLGQTISMRQNIIFSCSHINKWFKTLSSLWHIPQYKLHGMHVFKIIQREGESNLRLHDHSVSKIFTREEESNTVSKIRSCLSNSIKAHKHSDEKLGTPTSITNHHIPTKYQMGASIAHHGALWARPNS